MADRFISCAGCLLGMAVGDAMGYTVDEKTWEEITEDYGPNGLLGYDIVNGSPQVSSYTQIGAYAANGLLLGVTRGRPELFIKYVQIAMREWAKRQNLPGDPGRYYCWVSHVPSLRRKHCRDSRMLDALRLQNLGTVDEPRSTNANPGALTVAAMVGLAYDAKRMEPSWITELGAASVASTHGDAEAFLSGAVLANVIAGIVREPQKALKEQFLLAIEAMDNRYRMQFDQAAGIAAKLKLALQLPVADERQTMEDLVCDTASQCLAGAMYACLVSQGDFDTAMITAVNHSGRSAAVGALAGAILGAKLGSDALPEFYLEGLEVVQVLTELAKDLSQGSPTMGLFDDDWDQKYTQGMPVGNYL